MEYRLLSDVNFAENIDNRVFVVFLAKDVSVAPQKNGQQFISVSMKCKDIEINAKLFGAQQKDIDTFKSGHVYNAAVDVKPYAKSNTGWACVIYNYEENTSLQPAQFVEWAEGMKEAHETINRTLAVIGESDYKDLVYPILVDYWESFYVWTAASGMHHNILGGLLVHTAEVIDQCDVMADYWNNKYGPEFINKPLLLSAAMLHDICKVDELDVDKTSGSTSYSTHSSLSTHIMDIISKVDIQAYKMCYGRQYETNELSETFSLKSDEQIAIEKENLDLLKHCLAAHHGKKEYGSPIEPSIPEAYILNSVDEMSAEMYKYNRDFRGMEPGTSTHSWSSSGVNVTYKESSKM